MKFVDKLQLQTDAVHVHLRTSTIDFSRSLTFSFFRRRFLYQSVMQSRSFVSIVCAILSVIHT